MIYFNIKVHPRTLEEKKQLRNFTPKLLPLFHKIYFCSYKFGNSIHLLYMCYYAHVFIMTSVQNWKNYTIFDFAAFLWRET